MALCVWLHRRVAGYVLRDLLKVGYKADYAWIYPLNALYKLFTYSFASHSVEVVFVASRS